MRFTSLTTHLASYITSQSGIASQSGAGDGQEVAKLLDLSHRDLSFPNLELKLGELTQGLREPVSRPYSEAVLSNAAFLLDLNPRELLYNKIHGTDLDSFMSAVEKLAPVATQATSSAGAILKIPGKISSDSGRRLRQMAEGIDSEVAQAIGECALLTFLGGYDVAGLVADLRRLDESVYRPEVVATNVQIPGLSMAGLFVSRVVFSCVEKLEVLAQEAAPLLPQLPSKTARSIFALSLAQPGFLFFDHLVERSQEVREAIAPYTSCRDFLYAQTAEIPHLRAVLQQAVTSVSACMDQMMLVDERGYYEASALRPDSMTGPLTERVGRLVLLATRVSLDASERRRLEGVLREKIESDPVYGTRMAGAFSIPYPKAAGRPWSVLTIKVFPELMRGATASARTQHFLLAVTAPDIEESQEVRAETSRALAGRLERLLDELERVDRFTPEADRERAAQRCLILLNESFGSFEWLCAHGQRAIEPRFVLTSRAPVVVQFAQLWHALATIEPFLQTKGRDYFFRRIDDWIDEFSIQQGLRGEVTLSELAGAAPLFFHLGTQAELPDSEGVPSLDFVRRLYNNHKGCIDLLPSGFHALLSIFPQETRRKLVALMGKGLVIVDPPSQAAIHVLREYEVDAVQRLFRTLSLSSGTFKPVRLSQVSLRLGGGTT